MDIEQPIDFIDYAEGEYSLWDKFTSLQYEPEGLLQLLVLVLVFIAAKFVFRGFILSGKKSIKPEATNIAYSISAFSLFISLALILTSVVYGDVTTSTSQAIAKILTYAGVGIAMLVASGFIFDKIALNQINLSKAISEGNESAAIVDGGNFFASALIISAVLTWEEFKSIDSIIAILSLYIVSQLILTVATLIRTALFNNEKKSVLFHEQIKNNNKAAAIDFAGRRIATAFAITSATNLLSYSGDYDLYQVLIEWTAVSIIMVILLNAFAWGSSKLIYFGTDISGDITKGKTTSAILDAAIYISFGIILSGTLY